jgi:prepilin-type N-terminal cleavage/methylation domain-containing protein
MMKKIINLKQDQKGFTLVEMLASIIVIAAISSVIAGIITSSLRGSNKTNAVETIRQNGNYALDQISKNIEYAQVFNGLSQDEITYDISCPFSTPTPSVSPIAVKTFYNFIKVTPFNSDPIEYECTDPPLPDTPTFTVNGNEIFDTNSVSLMYCAITCTQTNATDVPIIGISFKLGPKNPNGLAENNNNQAITFQTSVTIRNYTK